MTLLGRDLAGDMDEEEPETAQLAVPPWTNLKRHSLNLIHLLVVGPQIITIVAASLDQNDLSSSIRVGAVSVLYAPRLQQRPMSVDFVKPHGHEGDYDQNPVDVVRDDGAVRCRVGPSEDAVEDAPATAAVDIGTATL